MAKTICMVTLTGLQLPSRARTVACVPEALRPPCQPRVRYSACSNLEILCWSTMVERASLRNLSINTIHCGVRTWLPRSRMSLLEASLRCLLHPSFGVFASSSAVYSSHGSIYRCFRFNPRTWNPLEASAAGRRAALTSAVCSPCETESMKQLLTPIVK
jgi:hypothetical protein